MPEPQKYFFLFDFIARDDAGLAVIIAQSRTAAVACLRQGGRYNCEPDAYHITTYKNVGKYYGRAHGLMLETYTNAAVVYEAIAALLDKVLVEAAISPSDSLPLMASHADRGTETKYARGDHRHPSDTSKQDVIADLAAIRLGASKGATAYQKPDGGIPYSDIASGVIHEVLSGTTAYWDVQKGLVPEEGAVIIYTDGYTDEEKTYPRIKIGTGNAYVQDLVFMDGYLEMNVDELEEMLRRHIIDTKVHLADGEREGWNKKVSVQPVENETLIFI